MPTKFEWKTFPGITAFGLEKIQELLTDLQCEPEQFKYRIIFMSMLTTMHGMDKETKKDVNTIHGQLRNMLVNSLAVIGLSCGLEQKRNGKEPTPKNQMDPATKLQRI